MEMKYILKDKWTVSFMETENIANMALLTIRYFLKKHKETAR